AEAASELLEKSLQDKKERLGSFDFVLELHLFGKNFRCSDEAEKTRGTAAGLFPKGDRFRPQPGDEFIPGHVPQPAQSMDAPAMKNGGDSRNFFRAFLCFRHDESLEELP